MGCWWMMKPLSPTVGLDVYVWASSRRRRGRTVKISCLYIFSLSLAVGLAGLWTCVTCLYTRRGREHIHRHTEHTPDDLQVVCQRAYYRRYGVGLGGTGQTRQRIEHNKPKRASIISPPGCLLSIFFFSSSSYSFSYFEIIVNAPARPPPPPGEEEETKVGNSQKWKEKKKKNNFTFNCRRCCCCQTTKK